jgi:ribosomal-protein-alanine N-acetyltransferase
MKSLVIRAFTADEAEAASRWTYEPPFDIYNGKATEAELFLERSEDGSGYYAIVDDETAELIGFCCFGPEARVHGQTEEPGTVDVGGGVRPDLVSTGLATSFFASVLAFGGSTFHPLRFRTAVAAFNERSLRLCRGAGFESVRTFDSRGGEFEELINGFSAI